MVYPRDAKMASIQRMINYINRLREKLTVLSKYLTEVSTSCLSKDSQKTKSTRSFPDLIKVVFKTPTAGFSIDGGFGSILSVIGDPTRTPALPTGQWSCMVLPPPSDTDRK